MGGPARHRERSGAAAAGSAPLKAFVPPPAPHMEGARSGARLLHSNATSNAASASPARLQAGPDGGSPRGTQPPGRREEDRKKGEGGKGGREVKISERKRGTCRAPGCVRGAEPAPPPGSGNRRSARPRSPPRRASAGRAARARARRGAEGARTHPSPAPARHPVPVSSRAPTCERACVRRRRGGSSWSPAKATASPTESPCRSAPSPPAPHFLSRPLRLEIPGETRSSSHTEGRARPGRSARRRQPGAGPALPGCT